MDFDGILHLCSQIAAEKDPQRLTSLIMELRARLADMDARTGAAPPKRGKIIAMPNKRA